MMGNGLLKEHQTRDKKAIGEACLAALEQWCMGLGAWDRGAVNGHSGPGTKGHWTDV